jgi:hypothetical protein
MKTYKVYHEYYGDDPQEFQAYDHESAAEKWAEDYDNGGDYTIVGQRDEPVVKVEGPDGSIKFFKVSGEAVPLYSAREVENEKA